jgi:sulfite oxidase
VTPGYAGVRSPKWLASVTIQDKPSDNHIQQKEYKLFPPGVTKQTADLGKGVVINDMPLNSAILEPMAGARLALGSNTVRGRPADRSGGCVGRWREELASGRARTTRRCAVELDVLECETGAAKKWR